MAAPGDAAAAQDDLYDSADESDSMDSQARYEADQQEAITVQQFSDSKAGSRRNSISAAPVTGDRLADWKGAPVFAKSEGEAERIRAVIQNSSTLQVLFGHLRGSAVDGVVGAMFSRDVEAGEVVIEQGTDGDYFYIVDSGVYDIFVQRHADSLPERVQVAQAGMSFGELALMYNVGRAATVKCVEQGRLWCLDRECFQMMLVTTENTTKREYESFLSQIDVLSALNSYELSKLSDLLTLEVFDESEEIVRQGEEGDSVFFLYEGECAAYIDGERGEVEVRHYTTPGEYFGEIALITNEPRRATVRAQADCLVLVLKREDVDLSIGNLRERLLENVERYPQYETLVCSGA